MRQSRAKIQLTLALIVNEATSDRVRVSAVLADSSFKVDLDIDSLEMMVIITNVSEQLKVTIPDELLGKQNVTVREMVEYIYSNGGEQ